MPTSQMLESRPYRQPVPKLFVILFGLNFI